MIINNSIQFGVSTDELADKVLFGKKTATSSLYDYYRLNLKQMHKVNDHIAILDSCGNEKCIVRIMGIEIVQFRDITEKFAIEEGDDSLENWLNIHTRYYSSRLNEIGMKLTGETELVCEWFKVITKK